MEGRVPVAALGILPRSSFSSWVPGLKLFKSQWKTFTQAEIMGGEMGSVSHSCLALPGGKTPYPTLYPTLQRWNSLC